MEHHLRKLNLKTTTVHINVNNYDAEQCVCMLIQIELFVHLGFTEFRVKITLLELAVLWVHEEIIIALLIIRYSTIGREKKILDFTYKYQFLVLTS